MESLVFKFEIICKPRCSKCANTESKIRTILDVMALREHIPIKYDFKFNSNFWECEKYGFKVSDLPVVLMNGKVIFVGLFKSERLIRVKIEEMLRSPF
jgi:hypothetical protein